MKKTMIWLSLVLLAMLIWAPQALAQEETAGKITGQCKFSFTSEGNSRLIKDGKQFTDYRAYGEGEQYVEIDFASNEAQGIYIKWMKPAAEWTLLLDSGEGFVSSEQRGNAGYVQEYIALPEGTQRIRLVTADVDINPLHILDIEVYGPGALPEEVHVWEPTPSSCELMVISTHQDDELLFFGGTVPYYAWEKDYDTVMLYMAFETGNRLHEALEGMWVCGLRQHPVFLCLPDLYAKNLSHAKKYWSEDEVTRMLTDQLLKYRPQVIVTHDENGEYGHGQHILTVECLKKALVNAASQEWTDENAPQVQPYNVPKCYLHMYAENKVVVPWDTLQITGAGKSAYEVAVEAFREHLSQWKTGFRVYITGMYDSRNYGLYHSAAGADTAKNDFFENIDLRIDDTVPAALPEGMEKSAALRKVYTYTDPLSGETQLLRHGVSGGVEGWYPADETGAPVLPVTAFEFFVDAVPAASGETIGQSQIHPALYVYRQERDGEETILRYGTWKGVTGWFLADEKGAILTDEPLEPVLSYPPVLPAELPVEIPAEKNTSALPVVFIAAAAVAALSVMLGILRAKKK